MMRLTAAEERLNRQLNKILDRFSRNHDWIMEHSTELEPYAGRYVAVDRGRVVGTSRSVGTLMRRFRKQQNVAIVYVPPPGPCPVRILALGAHSSPV